MKRKPYMPFFARDFIADTMHVSADAAAFYALLLSHAWMQGGSLPNDDRALRLLLRVSRQRWNGLRGEIIPFWKVGEDGRLHQKRLDKEWLIACRVNAGPETRSSATCAPHTLPKKRGFTTRARPGASGQAQNSLPNGRENSEARASLRVRDTHATPALRLVGDTEPCPPPDDGPPPADMTAEQRARIAAGFDRLVAEIAGAKLAALGEVPTGEVCAGTKAEIERKAAEEKLAQWAANPLPAPCLGYANGGGT